MNTIAFTAAKVSLLAVCLALPLKPAAAQSRSPVERLFAPTPQDPLALVYLDSPASLLTGKLPEQLLESAEAPLLQVLSAIGRAFDGPTVIALRMGPTIPGPFRITLATATKRTGAEWLTHLESALNDAAGPALVQIDNAGPMAALRPVMAPFITVYLGVKDGVALADTDVAAMDSFLKADLPPQNFLTTNEFKRLPGSAELAAGQRDALVYVNLRPFLPLLRAEMEGGIPDLFDRLHLDTIESASLAVQWKGPRLRGELGVGHSEPTMPLIRLAAQAQRSFGAAAYIPQDSLFLGSMALDSGSDWVEKVAEQVEPFAPEIVAEYREELAALTGKLGFDPQHDFLGNLVDELAVSWVLDESNQPQWTLLWKIGDDERFALHVQNIIATYKLPVRTDIHREVEIVTRDDGTEHGMSLAIVGDYAVVATGPQIIARYVDAWKDKTSLAQLASVHELARLLPDRSSQAHFVNLSYAVRAIFAEMEDRELAGLLYVAESIRKHAQNDALIASTMNATPDMLIQQWVLTESATQLSRDWLVEAVARSAMAARHHSRRTVSMSNLRAIVQGCTIYAADNNGQMPETLDALASYGIFEHVIRPPYTGAAASIQYLYRPADTRHLENPAATPIACESQTHAAPGGQPGACIAFADGHVEWLEGPEAERHIAALKRQ